MRLSDIESIIEDIDIYKDSEFETMGLSIARNNMKTLSFIENEKYIDYMSRDIACVITKKEIAKLIPDKMGVIIAKDPRNAFFKIHNKLAEFEFYKRESFKTKIGENSNISNMASISNMNVIIGNNVTIEEFVVIRENTVIGDNTIIRAGTIIGGEGFECKRKDNTVFSVKHLGGVSIGEGVDIKYNTSINKALYPWDETIIGDYSKIDDLVYLAHGCKIGNETMLAANSTIGGRSELGSKCWGGFGAIVSNGLSIGNNVRINLGAVVTKDVQDNKSVSGNFAIDHNKFIDFIKSIR